MKLTIPITLALSGFFFPPPQCSFRRRRPRPVQGWLGWRGPQQNGASTETGFAGQGESGASVVDGGFPGTIHAPSWPTARFYIMGYLGEGGELQEGVFVTMRRPARNFGGRCTVIFSATPFYLRYATSSPTVDEETGNVYIQGTQGILAAFTPNGKLLWKHSLMEEYGRLTFPNSRTRVAGD